MLRASIAKGKWRLALLALLLVAVAPLNPAWAGTATDAVTIQYRLLPEFTGTAQAGGRILVSLTNRSNQALSKVTLRLANPGIGKLTGQVQESIQLAAGETRQLEGEFVLATSVVSSQSPLEWVVVATAADGFAQQMFVRGEALQGATTDASARATAR